jgi:hypothetical protein
MKRKTPQQAPSAKLGLTIRSEMGTPLSAMQLKFNRLMKSLETAKANHSKEQARLDEALITFSKQLMPLVERFKRLLMEVVLSSHRALKNLKLSASRRYWFADFICCKIQVLLADPVGITDEEIHVLTEIMKELAPDDKEGENEDLDFLFGRPEQTEQESDEGFGDVHFESDLEEFERIAAERMKKAAPPPRRMTKAQLEKQRKKLEYEDAKKRDFKSLFKQLAKAFHPDLEQEPLLKQHKVIWMQRLNTAYANADLREMLVLEMEWLGEESTNLAHAGDEKLEIYCDLLKEQIAQIKRQTQSLLNEPQYYPLQRFRSPYSGHLSNPVSLKRALLDDLLAILKIRDVLAANKAEARRMICGLADEHAHDSSFSFFEEKPWD